MVVQNQKFDLTCTSETPILPWRFRHLQIRCICIKIGVARLCHNKTSSGEHVLKILCIIYSNDPETVWNAFRFANSFHLDGNTINIFLLGRGVEAASISTLQFDVQEQMDIFNEHGGNLIGCGVCCDIRKDEIPNLKEQLNCEIGSMQQLNLLVFEADKVITF